MGNVPLIAFLARGSLHPDLTGATLSRWQIQHELTSGSGQPGFLRPALLPPKSLATARLSGMTMLSNAHRPFRQETCSIFPSSKGPGCVRSMSLGSWKEGSALRMHRRATKTEQNLRFTKRSSSGRSPDRNRRKVGRQKKTDARSIRSRSLGSGILEQLAE